MEGTYEVYYRGQSAGWVQVERRGLYYLIHCRCRPIGKQMLELTAAGERLGVLVPSAEGLELEKRVPIKHFSGEGFSFSLQTRAEGKMIPVDPEKPFAFLQDLDRAYLMRQGEQLGIGLRKNSREKGEIRD